jgi:hypothetical protein
VNRSIPIRIWRMPVVLAAVTAFGLVAALVVDGLADASGWIPLGVPLAVVAWLVSPRVQRRRAQLAIPLSAQQRTAHQQRK